ncbi:concanavalin A-like lectin/glucanase domain-containing protein [Achaetomium macrosporum]|uniref:Concanavalin A-like lectin/glucanase domain-containing protein n=1 Tax=Achaetomium macrosporum TaxID=79813 RepID=A0AAN7CHM7_9PEZI|nr:concanavalin A-like lectin/glucanase domain-containing protein [Achaetomium macrosporum]
MRPTTLLTLLLTTAAGASAASLRLPLAPTRPRDAPRLRLLHTFSAPSNARVLSASAPSTESTKGGAILTLDDGSLISSVQGTFRVPPAEPPTSGPTANNPVGVYATSFWVGIDSARPPSPSNSPCGGSLRAGVDIFFDGTIGGPQSPFAWYQFAPGMGSAVGFDEGFSVAEGDLVRFTLNAGNGEVVVLAENFGGNVTCVNTNGTQPIKSVRQVLSPSARGRLCRTEAAFLVEDFPLDGRPDVPVALANFTSVAFGTRVTLGDGSVRDLAGAEVLDVRQLQQGGKLTSCEVAGDKVKCARVVQGDT